MLKINSSKLKSVREILFICFNFLSYSKKKFFFYWSVETVKWNFLWCLEILIIYSILTFAVTKTFGITKIITEFTYLLTPRSRVLLEKLTGSKLVKNFPAFYGTRRFITAFTSSRHLSLSLARSIQSMPRIPLHAEPS